jgi:hypothetical protein
MNRANHDFYSKIIKPENLCNIPKYLNHYWAKIIEPGNIDNMHD